MRFGNTWVMAAGLLIAIHASGYDIGLVPLHEFSDQEGKRYGLNISLQGTPRQIKRARGWLAEIARVPKGYETLVAIADSGHKLMIFHSADAIISSGKASAPLSGNLINGRGESVDIFFNFDIPDSGSHQVLDTRGSPIEYTAIQNLYHELAHAMHLMNGTWHYAKSERQAIEEENIFRFQLARMKSRPFLERVYVNGIPICPNAPDRINVSWQQDLICL